LHSSPSSCSRREREREREVRQLVARPTRGPCASASWSSFPLKRPLFFLDLAALADPSQNGDVLTLALVQHLLLARASVAAFPLPHILHGRTEAEYVRWLNEHREEERIGLVEGVVRRWEDQREEGGAVEKRGRGSCASLRADRRGAGSARAVVQGFSLALSSSRAF